MCPAVISCAILTLMDNDPASVWFKGNTAGSQAVCPSPGRVRVSSACVLPAAAGKPCDAPAVHIWLPLTPNCLSWIASWFWVLVVRYVWYGDSSHVAVGFGPCLQDTGGRRCSCLMCCSYPGTRGLVSLLLRFLISIRFT